MLRKGILLSFVLSSAMFASHWDYEENGPNVWGSLDKNWKLCATGKEQSPINIISKDAKNVKNTLIRSYESNSKSIVNNGHSIQVNYENSGSASIEGESFELKQFHFHTPSETYINGEAFPLEIHFVHQNNQGKLLVISVMAKEGKSNKSFEKILNAMPKKKDESKDFVGFDPSSLVPKQSGYFEFMGSLTTPPCSEGVTWIVLKENVRVSKEQIEKMHQVIHNNARNTQPINHRQIQQAD